MVAMSRLIATASPRVAHRVAEHGPAYRVIHRHPHPLRVAPAATCQSCRRPVAREREEHAAGDGEDREPGGEQPLAVEAGGEGADGGAEQHGREGPCESIAVTRNGEPVSWNV